MIVFLRALRAFALLLVVGLASACPVHPGPDITDSGESGERRVELPSGATFKIAADWSVETRDYGLAVASSKGKLSLEVVETKDSEIPAAMAKAWNLTRTSFERELQSSEELPAKNGWKKILESDYKTAPSENRFVVARGFQHEDGVVVVLADVPADETQRQLPDVLLIWNNLRAPGYAPVSFADREMLPLNDTRLDEIRQFVEEGRKIADIPGVAVAVFDADEILMAEGFGVRERGKSDPVTADTLFMMASNTKGLTTLLLAVLVDEGKFDWDTPVVDVYPEFRLGDPETTQKVKMKHLVCACTGLPRQDAEWLFTWKHTSPEEQLEVLATMKPTTEFGEKFQYSNPLASAAGFIAAHSVYPDKDLGTAYDQLMREKILAPLGMDHTTFSFEKVRKSVYAAPHAFDAEGRSVAFDIVRNRTAIAVRPAGGGWTTVRDYARYLQLELNEGSLPDGSALLSKENLLIRRKPGLRAWGENQRYGMGLVTNLYYGVPVVEHGGSLQGYQSQFFIIPDEGIGAVVLTNANTGFEFAFEHFTQGMMEILYGGERHANEALRQSIASTRGAHAARVKELVAPTAAIIEQLAPTYRSPDLGEIVVHETDGKLEFEFAGWTSAVALKKNPDGSISFITIDPGFSNFEFAATKPDGHFEHLTYREPQQTYQFDEVK